MVLIHPRRARSSSSMHSWRCVSPTRLRKKRPVSTSMMPHPYTYTYHVHAHCPNTCIHHVHSLPLPCHLLATTNTFPLQAAATNLPASGATPPTTRTNSTPSCTGCVLHASSNPPKSMASSSPTCSAATTSTTAVSTQRWSRAHSGPSTSR
jgi:hypothetical protein